MNISVLAEICGLHAGDGYLRNDGKRIELDISGNVEEKEFYDDHVITLFSRFFKINIKGKHFLPRNTYGFVIRDKKIVEFIHHIGFPYGKKTTKVEIPEFILKSKDTEVYAKFIRGLFDADGSFNPDKRYGTNYAEFKRKYHYYPRISIGTCSKKLMKQVCDLLIKLGIKSYTQTYFPKKSEENIRYKIWVVGKENVKKWMKLIGSKNPTQISKYAIWKKFGFCPPHTTLEQRKQILKNNLNPSIFYGPVAQLG